MTDTRAASPNAAGPAGARLEAGVAAHYLLALLRGEDARGLPGVSLTRVKLQRAAANHPLDDVIVEGQSASGTTVWLDIQVKRQVQFSPGDAVFRKIMGQVADTLRLGEDAQANRDLAIATSQTSRKIDGPYQDVLTWARAISEPSIFFERIRQHGSASEDHRRFVDTVTAHLKDEGVDHDDRAVWALLRRLQILVFDLDRDGSLQQALTREQCLAALAPEAAGQATTLQAVLETLALEIAAEGGDVTRQQLLDRLARHRFQFSGERRFAGARATLAEASAHVLAEIDDRLGEIVLLRPQVMAKVNEALDQGRYIEIRGAGGVGKSSVLKHLAQALGAQGRMIALSSDRTEVGGWARLRNTLEFPGSAKDLLVDLAAAGGGMLLVDGLDNFEPHALTLVRDLVDAAVQTPGFQVVVTARLAFGVDNENWISSTARRALGAAPAVRIDELSDEEIDQLRRAAPLLVPLLADGHPAQAVARNLYRLGRLLAQGADPSDVHTEVELADLWWRTGDGPDAGRRPRTRILQEFADQVLAGSTKLETRSLEPAPLEALVRSETLRDLGGEQMVFRHDILRDWALFERLRERPEALTDVHLAKAPTPSLLRAVELLARHSLEHVDLDAWRQLLECVSAPGRHSAWRRAVLLALVRSEAAAASLDLAAQDLLAEDGRLLQDLIRLTLAVEAQSLAELVTQAGQTPTEAMARIAVPAGPSWNRLTAWLLTLGDRLPSKATPDAVTLWARWLQFTSGRGRSSAAIVRRFHAWLAQAMDDKEAKAKDTLSGFGDGFDKGLYASVVETLRGYVVAFAGAAPDLAAPYVERLRTLKYENEAADDAVLDPGELASAAPHALAALTFERLAEGRPGIRRSRRDRWSFLDGQFIAESPSRGPFMALLKANPAIGLALVRRMVEHAVAPGPTTPSGAPFLDDDDDDDADLFPEEGTEEQEDRDTLRLAFDSGERLVTHLDYYELSRPVGSDGYAAASSLMALEAWAQDRLDKQEPLASVLADVLGEGPIPAPLLLVAVDLLLSHWNAEAPDLALPLVGNPRLLAMDFSRQTHERTRYGPLSRGLGKPEPGTPPFTLEDLGRRPSRENTLSGVVWLYARGEETRRLKLRALIEAAASELPPKKPYYGWGDPRFTAERMLHMLEPANWTSDVHPETGAPILVYNSPEDPVLQARADAAMDNVRMMNAQAALARAVESVEPTPEAQLAFALAIAQGEQAASRYDTNVPAGADDEAQTKAAAALVLARDISSETWPSVAEWVRARVVEGLAAEERMGGGLRYDVAGMAFVTLVHLLRRDWNEHDLAALLTAAASPRHKAYAGFAATIDIVETIDPNLPESVLRCALTARVNSWLPWDAPETLVASEKAARSERGRRAVAAELAWLGEGGEPPPWPDFPLQRPTQRQGVRLPTAASASALAAALGIAPVAAAERLGPESIEPEDEAPDEFDEADAFDDDENDGIAAVPTVEDGAAAEWLELLPPDGATRRPWRLNLVRTYAGWTYVKNGAGLGRHATLNGNFRSWNEAFFYQLGLATPHMTAEDLAKLVFEPLASLPDKQRLAAATPLLLAIDEVFFNDQAITADQAVAWREEIAERVRETSGWADLRGKETDRIEVTLGPAVSTLFFARRHAAGSYLKPLAADRLDPFMPTLSRLVADCPNLSVAAAHLSSLEVKPRGGFAAPLLAAVQVWLTAFPQSTRFWREAGIGQRACAIFEAIRVAEPEALVSLGQDLDGVLGKLVALGITEAGRLEQRLSELRAQAGSRG